MRGTQEKGGLGPDLSANARVLALIESCTYYHSFNLLVYVKRLEP